MDNENISLSKILKKVDVGNLLPIVKKLEVNGRDVDDLFSAIGKEIDINGLLSTLFPSDTSSPADNTTDIDETFSFILPEETVKMLDGLLLEIFPVETLAKIDEAIDIDRLFSITLPSEIFSVVSNAIKDSEVADVDALVSTIVPGNGKGKGIGIGNGKGVGIGKGNDNDVGNGNGNGNGKGNNNESFSFILPEETVKLLDGLLLQVLPAETLAKIDDAIDIDRLFSITLPTETFAVASEVIKDNDNIDLDALVSTILLDSDHDKDSDSDHHGVISHDTHTEIIQHETLTKILLHETFLEIIRHDIHTEIHHETHTKVHQDDDHQGAGNNSGQTFSFILPEDTVKLLDGLLLEVLPVETLAKIDDAIDIVRLFSITIPTETFSIVSDAIQANEVADMDALVSSIVSSQLNENDTFSFLITEDTLEMVDELLFEVLPASTLAQIDQAIDVERLFSIALPFESFSMANDAIVQSESADVNKILATILPDDELLTTDEISNVEPAPEFQLI